MCILEFIRHSLVGDVPVLVIKRQTLPGEFVSLGFDCVRVVITQDSLATGRMQSHLISNAVWDLIAGFDLPSFDLDPVAILLINDLVLEVKQRSDLVFIQRYNISPDDIYCVFL